VSTTFEALYLNGTSNEGVNNNQLGIASSIAAEFNQEFAITAADGESTLLVINDLNGNSAAVWQWVQNTQTAGNTAEIDTNELTLIAIINANATITTDSFAFI
jgi:hypothetical protein